MIDLMRPRGGQTGANVLVQAEAEDVEHLQVERVVDDDLQLAALGPQGEDEVLAHQVFGDQRDGVGRDGAAVELHVFHVVLRGQRLVDVALGAELQVDQGLTDPQALGLGMVERFIDFLGGDDAPFDEDFAQLLLLLGHRDTSPLKVRYPGGSCEDTG